MNTLFNVDTENMKKVEKNVERTKILKILNTT